MSAGKDGGEGVFYYRHKEVIRIRNAVLLAILVGHNDEPFHELIEVTIDDSLLCSLLELLLLITFVVVFSNPAHFRLPRCLKSARGLIQEFS